MNKLYSLFTRYILILIFGLGNLFIFYKIFYPLTFMPVNFILEMLGETKVFYTLNLILYNTIAIDLVGACIAGAAYYLIFILVMSTGNLASLKRLKILLLSMLIFLVFNIVRIIIMVLIANKDYFTSVHMFFWYFISIIFVVLIWFLMVRLFKIKDIPVYSDLKFLLNSIRGKK